MPASKKRAKLAICVENEGYDDLDVWKIYQVLPDARAEEVGCLRVIDESGEDYLYPGDRFASIDFPDIVRSRLPVWRPSRRNVSPAAPKTRRRLSA